MTVKQLIKILEKCNPRSEVAVFVDTFEKVIEEWNTIPVESAEEEFLQSCDGDGFSEWRKDGSAKGRTTVILRGNKKLNEF